MGIIEDVQRQQSLAEKAKAFDDLQKQAEVTNVYNKGMLDGVQYTLAKIQAQYQNRNSQPKYNGLAGQLVR